MINGLQNECALHVCNGLYNTFSNLSRAAVTQTIVSYSMSKILLSFPLFIWAPHLSSSPI